MAWYRVNNFGRHYYENMHSGAGSVAEAGLNDFDTLKQTQLVLSTGCGLQFARMDDQLFG